MNIDTYRERRRLQLAETPRFRELCTTCFQPGFGCYCEHVRSFDPLLRFVILIHPVEARRRIATGRMSHLSLERSQLVLGCDFSKNRVVNEILNDPTVHPVLLYPGPSSVNLTPLPTEERASIFPAEKEPVLFVIDGTWATARQMVRSANLKSLPRICFSPEQPSRFRVRKQPAEGCYSTIEAVHHAIELLGESRGFAVAERRHDALLDVFDVMVERQLKCVQTMRSNRQANYRRERARLATESVAGAVATARVGAAAPGDAEGAATAHQSVGK